MSAKLHKLYHKQNGRCFYCKRECWYPATGEKKEAAMLRLGVNGKKLQRRRATVEHLIRKCEGGRDAGNIVMACEWCNSTRHERSVEHHLHCVAKSMGMGS